MAKFAVDAGVDVIGQHRGAAECLLQGCLQRCFRPAEIGHLQHDAAIEVERAGTADADAPDLSRCNIPVLEQIPHQADHALQARLGARVRVRAFALPGNRAKLIVEQHRQHFCAAEVEANPVAVFLVRCHRARSVRGYSSAPEV